MALLHIVLSIALLDRLIGRIRLERLAAHSQVHSHLLILSIGPNQLAIRRTETIGAHLTIQLSPSLNFAAWQKWLVSKLHLTPVNFHKLQLVLQGKK